jgi:hypothetical protein
MLRLSCRFEALLPCCLVALGDAVGLFYFGRTPNSHKACTIPLQLAAFTSRPPPHHHWFSPTIRQRHPTLLEYQSSLLKTPDFNLDSSLALVIALAVVVAISHSKDGIHAPSITQAG